MRSFEERKEEIFRRSEKKIAHRKKTVRQVIATCVPLVLCLGTLSGIWLLRGPTKMDNAAPEAAGSDLNYGMVADQESDFNENEICDCPLEAPGQTPSMMAPENPGAENTKENTPASSYGTPAGEHRPLYQDEVIELAKEQVNWDYDAVTAEQDPETGEWTVTFWARDREEFQVVIVGADGGILQVTEGMAWANGE